MYDDTMTNLDYTYTLDKVSCVKGVWYIHVAFALLVILAGFGCLATRMVCHHMHVWFGRMYIICMFWCMGTSLVVHNTGLPVAVLISFVWVLSGLSLGWIMIKLHLSHVERKAYEKFGFYITGIQSEELKKKVEIDGVYTLMSQFRRDVVQLRSLRDRMISCKAAHGVLMFMSFMNIFGRIFGVTLSNGFTCHTFPYYKQVDSPKFTGLDAPLTPVPIRDANYSSLPWAHGLGYWGLELSVGPIIVALAVGVCVAWRETKCLHRKEKENQLCTRITPELYLQSIKRFQAR